MSSSRLLGNLKPSSKCCFRRVGSSPVQRHQEVDCIWFLNPTVHTVGRLKIREDCGTNFWMCAVQGLETTLVGGLTSLLRLKTTPRKASDEELGFTIVDRLLWLFMTPKIAMWICEVVAG